MSDISSAVDPVGYILPLAYSDRPPSATHHTTSAPSTAPHSAYSVSPTSLWVQEATYAIISADSHFDNNNSSIRIRTPLGIHSYLHGIRPCCQLVPHLSKHRVNSRLFCHPLQPTRSPSDRVVHQTHHGRVARLILDAQRVLCLCQSISGWQSIRY